MVDTVREPEEHETVLNIEQTVAEVPAEWEVGDVILNLYAVTGLLGQGGMGKVFKVRHLGWNTDLAVKCPKASLLKNRRAMEAFQLECETWVNLSLHPHVVTCYYVRQLGAFPRIFSEYVEGGSLRTWIMRGILYHTDPQKTLERILSVGIQIAWGLHHAHEQGLVHRDVKPANVLMTANGMAKVTDFGLASARLRVATLAGEASGDRLASAGGMTPAYCSPEQSRYEKVSQRTDTWSWALCMLEMLIGRVTWRKGPKAPRALDELLSKGPRRPGIPPPPQALADLLRWCCKPDPQERPESMLAVGEALRAVYRDVAGTDFPMGAPRSIGSRAESLNNRAISLLDLGKTAEAESTWANALRVDPKHTESTFNLGILRWRTGRIDDESLLQQMREVCSMHPGEMLPQNLLTQIHLERGDCQAALQLLEDLTQRFPEQEASLLSLTAVQSRLPHGRRLLQTLEGHADAVHDVRLNRRGDWALSGSEDNTVKLWDMATGRCLHTFAGHTKSVQSVDISRDSQVAVSIGRDRTIRLWDLPTGAGKGLLRGRNDLPSVACISPKYDRLLVGSYEGVLTLWDLKEEVRLETLTEHSGEITATSIAPDASWALSSSLDGSLKLWDLTTFECIQTYTGHEGAVLSATFSGRGRYALSGGEDGTLHFLDVTTGQCIRTLTGHTGSVNGVALARGCRYAASGGKDTTVRLWDLVSGRCLRTYRGHAASVSSVDISRDLAHIVSASEDGTIKVWNLGSKMDEFAAPLVLCKALRSETAVSMEAAFARELEAANRSLQGNEPNQAAEHVRAARSLPGFRRNRAAVGLWGSLYRHLRRSHLDGIWEGEVIDGGAGALRTIAMDEAGRIAVSGGDDAKLRMWELSTGRCLRTLEGHTDTINSVAVSLEGRHAVSGSADNTVRYWDLQSGHCLGVFEEHAGVVESVCISPDGRFSLSGGWNTKLWDLASRRCLRNFGGQTAAVFCTAWSPDGRTILTGTSEEDIKVWDVVEGRIVQSLEGHDGVVRALALSADGRYVAACANPMWGQSGKVFLWDTRSGRMLRLLRNDDGAVNAVDLTQDGRHILSGDSGNGVRIWDAHSGECIRVISEQAGNPQAVQFSKDARWVVSAGEDGMIRTWVLDWELEEQQAQVWDPHAQPCLDCFVDLHRPFAAPLDPGESPGSERVGQALRRKGKPSWTNEDVDRLMFTLGCIGLGQLAREEIEEQLERAKRPSLRRWLNDRFGSFRSKR